MLLREMLPLEEANITRMLNNDQVPLEFPELKDQQSLIPGAAHS
jgi:hypothetical protein